MVVAGESPEPTLGEHIRRRASSLFLAQGIDATPLREIAAGLDVTKAALYYHYPSKEALVRALLTPYLDELGATLLAYEELTSSSEPIDRQALLADLLEVRRRHTDALALLHDPAVRRIERLNERNGELTARSIAALTSDMADGRVPSSAIGALAVLDAFARPSHEDVPAAAAVELAARLVDQRP